MEKTAREWLMELKPEHRDLAIENAKKQDEKFLDIRFKKTIEQVLICSFTWNESKQGFKFWNNIHNQLITNTYYDEEAKS